MSSRRCCAVTATPRCSSPAASKTTDPLEIHRRFAEVLDTALDQIAEIKQRAQEDAAAGRETERPAWPMIVFRTPKGWTGPKEVDGEKAEGSWRSHQVPLGDARDTDEHLAQLDDWLRSYRPEELFDETGRLREDIAEAAPTGEQRMSANPSTNGGSVLTPLRLPDFRDYAVEVPSPGARPPEATKVLGAWLRDVMRENPQNFPDLRPGRDRLEPPAVGLRGHRQAVERGPRGA